MTSPPQAAHASSTPTSPPPGGTPRGRPRSAECTEAILDTAADLLDEIGYESLTMQAVAERAGVSMATIYRRWPTKSALFADAIERLDPLAALPDTGNPHDDLRAAMRFYARTLVEQEPDRRCQNYLAVVRSDPEVAKAYSEHVFNAMRCRLRQIVARAVGDDDPDIEARADLGPALLLYRAEVLHQMIDPDAAGDEVAELMLRPTPGV
ncbi:MAG TPA: TetR/AcrR family transcriptional regulator [Acidimicrobiales bacterium]|nr:TetR/AcrR family transcriptional regulator [Acidimicrobiales bacterium]